VRNTRPLIRGRNYGRESGAAARGKRLNYQKNDWIFNYLSKDPGEENEWTIRLAGI